MKPLLTIYYDKDCRACSRYADYLRLQDHYTIDLRNARIYPHIMQDYLYKGKDINAGIIIQEQDHTYHGARAILHLQYLLTQQRWYTRTMTTYLRIPVYTCINRMRKTILSLQGKQHIPTE